MLTGPLYQDTSSFLQSSPRTSVRPELCHKVVSSCMGGWESDYVVKEGKGRGGLGPSTGLATLGGHVSSDTTAPSPELGKFGVIVTAAFVITNDH